MWRNALVVGAVAALGVAALVDTIRGGEAEAADPGATAAEESSTAQTLTGPDVPPAGSLPGQLVVAEADGCRVRVLRFADAALGSSGEETLCRVWVAPKGGLAVVPTARGERADVRRIELVRLDDPPESVRELGAARGEVAWSPDGSRLAWCAAGGFSIVHELGSGKQERIRGCHPRFTTGGSVITRPDRPLTAELWLDGEPLLSADDFAQGFESGPSRPLDLLEFDVSSSGVIAATVAKQLAPSGTQLTLQLWRDGQLDASIGLPRLPGPGNTLFGGFLRFGPTGNELAIGYTPGAGELSLVDLELGRVLVRSIAQSALAWSPDGAWLALAVDDEIRVYGAVRDEPSYVLPLSAVSLAWIPGEEPPPQG